MGGIKIDFLSDVAPFLRGAGDVTDAMENVADSLDDLAREAGDSSSAIGRELSDAGDKAADAGRKMETELTRSLERAGDGAADAGQRIDRELRDALDGAADDAKRAGTEIETELTQALDAVGDEAKTAGDKLERHLENAAEESERAAKDLKGEFQTTFDAVRADAKTAGDSIGKSTREGVTEANGAMSELKDEARQNAAEVFSSFDGSLESIVDGVQGTFGGIVSSLGPAGMIGGAIAAAGIGLGKALWEKSQEEAEATRERVSELANELIEAGQGGEVSLGFVVDRLREIATETDPAKDNLRDLRDDADRLGVSFGALARGSAGDLKSVDAALQNVRDRIAELEERRDGGPLLDYVSDIDLTTQVAQLGEMADKLEGVRDEADLGVKAYEAWVDAGGPAMAAQADATEEYRDSVLDALDEAGQAWEDYTTDGVTDLNAYADAMEEQIKSVQQYEANMVTASKTLSTEALNYVRSMGAEAAPLLAQFVAAPLDQQSRLASVWDQLGRSAVGGYQDAMSELTPATVTAVSNANRAAPSVNIPMKIDSSDLQSRVNSAANSIRRPTIYANMRVLQMVD